MSVTIYHNPRCSKSRQALKLIEEHGIKPKVILYLETPPNKEELQVLLNQLEISPRDLLRESEGIYWDENLNDSNLSDELIIDAMIKYPQLMQRPIVISNGKAKICRPCEKVMEIL